MGGVIFFTGITCAILGVMLGLSIGSLVQLRELRKDVTNMHPSRHSGHSCMQTLENVRKAQEAVRRCSQS